MLIGYAQISSGITSSSTTTTARSTMSAQWYYASVACATTGSIIRIPGSLASAAAFAVPAAAVAGGSTSGKPSTPDRDQVPCAAFVTCASTSALAAGSLRNQLCKGNIVIRLVLLFTGGRALASSRRFD